MFCVYSRDVLNQRGSCKYICFPCFCADMYDNMGNPPGAQKIPFGNAFSGAGSGLIRGGLGAYGEKILGSSSEYVQSNVSSLLGLETIFKIYLLSSQINYANRFLLKFCSGGNQLCCT